MEAETLQAVVAMVGAYYSSREVYEGRQAGSLLWPQQQQQQQQQCWRTMHG